MCQNGRPELWDSKWVGQVQVDAMGSAEMPRRRRRSQKKAVLGCARTADRSSGIVSGLARFKLMPWAVLRCQGGGGEARKRRCSDVPERQTGALG